MCAGSRVHSAPFAKEEVVDLLFVPRRAGWNGSNPPSVGVGGAQGDSEDSLARPERQHGRGYHMTVKRNGGNSFGVVIIDSQEDESKRCSFRIKIKE